MPHPDDYEQLSVDEVPLENIREVVAALARRLGLTLHRYEWQDGGRDFEFRPEK